MSKKYPSNQSNVFRILSSEANHGICRRFPLQAFVKPYHGIPLYTSGIPVYLLARPDLIQLFSICLLFSAPKQSPAIILRKIHSTKSSIIPPPRTLEAKKTRSMKIEINSQTGKRKRKKSARLEPFELHVGLSPSVIFSQLMQDTAQPPYSPPQASILSQETPANLETKTGSK